MYESVSWSSPGHHASSNERFVLENTRFYVHTPIINNQQKDNFSRFLSLRHASWKLMKKWAGNQQLDNDKNWRILVFKTKIQKILSSLDANADIVEI